MPDRQPDPRPAPPPGAVTDRRRLRYRNGQEKRAAIAAVERRLRAAGAFAPERRRGTEARLGFRPAVILDTNSAFALTEYWSGPDLRAALRELLAARPALRIYLLDVVASEIRGRGTHRDRYDDTVFNGTNADRAVAWPLPSRGGEMGALASRMRRAVADRRDRASAVMRPSDGKDALIAAAAATYDMAIVTANVADFEALRAVAPGLRVLAIDAPGHERLLGALVLAAVGDLLLGRAPSAARPGGSDGAASRDEDAGGAGRRPGRVLRRPAP